MKDDITEKEYRQDTDRHPSATRVADLDSGDKPREKALTHGIETLTNAELIAIILGSGMPGKSVLDLSREILRTNDNRLWKVARMSILELTRRYDGIGPAKAISLAAAIELGTRCMRDAKVTDEPITGSKSIYDRYHGMMEFLPYEQFRVAHLNRSNRVIYEECISKGGTASTVVDVKMIMKSAVERLSDGLIFVHNHPSGNLTPSPQDDQLTQRLKKAAEILDMRVLDHIIIARGGYYSYADKGRL